jgi:uncharacterized protein (DUF4415 family)
MGGVFVVIRTQPKAPVKRRGRPPSDKSKVLLTLRLDPEVIAKFKSTGPGWQSLMNACLRTFKFDKRKA